MKNLIIVVLLVISSNLWSQEISGISINTQKYSEDSEIKVSYKDSLKVQNINNAAIFINGNFIEHQNTLNTINPNKIESVQVEKAPFEKNGKEYYGKIIIQTKFDYEPNFITLKQLCEKYLPAESNPKIFIIDDSIVNENENDYVIDENYILKIELTKIKNPELNSDVNVIKLITKTPENIKKANEIMIRGN